MRELEEKVYKTVAYYQAKALHIARGIWFDVAAPIVKQPVFVVGCSRAGTTLVYKTLSESSRLGSLQKETHDFWANLHPPEERHWDSHGVPPECAAESDRRQVARLFYSRTGQCRFVDKNNQNGLSIPYLLRLFPDAFFVYVKRNPGDNIHSLIEGWKRAEVFGTWSDRLPERVNIEAGRFQRWCFFLPLGWRAYRDTSIEEVCAFQYREMNASILEARSLVAQDRWCELFYEDILDDPIEAFSTVFAHCRVPFDDHLRRHSGEVLQKPYNAFSRIGKDKWKATLNREKIERVLPTVQTVAGKMGYS
ncbi:sulfotransferase family protein [Methylohalobius crimeensis]|uniref:sulfotransferase family protein n=1 Tax=Methylohalobius crimeensis TaxID=244365 RepID=UPI0003B74961|nr:sulfotransferase [Methylohalobius crimeensis]